MPSPQTIIDQLTRIKRPGDATLSARGMTDRRGERWGAVSGIASLACGITGGALERGWPIATDPAAVARFVALERAEILGQSSPGPRSHPCFSGRWVRCSGW